MYTEQQRNAARSSVTEVDQRQENAEAAIMRAEAAVEMARLTCLIPSYWPLATAIWADVPSRKGSS